MTKKATRIKAESFATEAEFSAACDRVTWIGVETTRLTAVRDAVLLRVKERYNAKIKALEDERDLKTTRCALYAQENRGVLLPDETKSKSRATHLSWWGFRLGNPKLETLKGWTWTKVLAALKAKGLTDYIRVKEEPDKEGMTADAKKHGHLCVHDETGGAPVSVALADVGVKLDQDEAFFIEPKVEEAKAS